MLIKLFLYFLDLILVKVGHVLTVEGFFQQKLKREVAPFLVVLVAVAKLLRVGFIKTELHTW